MGLHFIGNDGDVDVKGFLSPQVAYSLGGSSVLTRMPTNLKAGNIKDSRKVELKSVTNCWICEGWSQHYFKYQPGISDERKDHDPFVPINLHLDIDHFEGDMMLPDENNPNLYEIWRMLPPGKHKYFYSVGNSIQVAKDQPQGDGLDKNLTK